MSSSYEDKINDILFSERLNFKREVEFNNLRGVRTTPLRFDFVVFKQGRIDYIIEVDGEQHFAFNKFFHRNNKIMFRRQREYDRRKNSYCLKNNYTLYRIPYWEIENINNLGDIFNSRFLVVDKFHNDNIINDKFL